MTDDEAKKLVRAAASVLLDAVLSIIQDDPHGWSKRPCDSCRIVSSIIGKPFGCYEYQERHK